jgi:hypothetical protein
MYCRLATPFVDADDELVAVSGRRGGLQADVLELKNISQKLTVPIKE